MGIGFEILGKYICLGTHVCMYLMLIPCFQVSFWRQYEQGVLTDVAVQILIGVAETTSDKELHMIHARDFQKYWVVHGFYHWVRIKIIKKLGIDKIADRPPKPTSKCRRVFWWLTTRDWFVAFLFKSISPFSKKQVFRSDVGRKLRHFQIKCSTCSL